MPMPSRTNQALLEENVLLKQKIQKLEQGESTLKQQKVELKLVQQRFFLRQVIDLIPNLLYVKDSESRYLMANKALADAYGSTPDQIIGKTDRELGATEEQSAGFCREDKEVLRTGQVKFTAEEPFTVQSGALNFYQTTKLPLIDNRGVSLGVLGVSVDITERKRADLALREMNHYHEQILLCAQEGVIVFDPELRYLFWNPFMEQLSGMAATEVLGKHLLEVFPHLVDSPISEKLNASLSGKTSDFSERPYHVPGT
ncbi:MAG: PAS domain-containing protein, partial [Pseudomonadota bacterium]